VLKTQICVTRPQCVKSGFTLLTFVASVVVVVVVVAAAAAAADVNLQGARIKGLAEAGWWEVNPENGSGTFSS
jgi:hypothetical protein